MQEKMESGGVIVDYAAVVDAESLGPVATGPAVALVAGRLGGTRLLDNRQLPARGVAGR